MSRLKRDRQPGRVRLVADMRRWYPWVRCIEAPADHPDWQDGEWLRLDDWRPVDCAKQSCVATMADGAAKKLQERYGGKWCGVVRPDGQQPGGTPDTWGEEARIWSEDHIRTGPDGPGHRSLRKPRSGGVTGRVELRSAATGDPGEPKMPTLAELDRIAPFSPNEDIRARPKQFPDDEFDEFLKGDTP